MKGDKGYLNIYSLKLIQLFSATFNYIMFTYMKFNHNSSCIYYFNYNLFQSFNINEL